MTNRSERGAPPASFRSALWYVWPSRVAIASVLALVGLPFLAFWPSAAPFLAGLFDPVNDAAVVLVTALALFNAWTTVIVGALILTYGGVRLRLPPLSLRFFPVGRWAWAVSSLLAVPTLWRMLTYAHTASGHSRAVMLAYAGLGAIVAVALLGVALWISSRLDDTGSALRQRVAVTGIERGYAWVLTTLSRWPSIASGFLLHLGDTSRAPELASGHALAFGLACSSVGLYAATGFLTRNVQRPELASALAYVLLLQLVLTWLVGVAAFLIDRTRIPLAIATIVWIVLVNAGLDRLFPTDYVYRTVRIGQAPQAALPADLIRPPFDAGDGVSIVVAAAGGGIQAAAWTARALTSLASVPGFSAHLRLISAVSGGSVGAMNVVAGEPECGPPLSAPDAADDVVHFDANRGTRESSLHAVGWGLVFKDLPRTLLPFSSMSPAPDRGSVLEDAWKREARLKKPYPDRSAMLASWRRNVAAGRCPAVIFNAMSAETGDPMLFATVRLPDTLAPFDFYRRYPNRDLPITTAVRLSAAFPYVSPAARADADDWIGRYTHVVDGGYFDNYGVSTLAAVVDAGLRAATPVPAPRRRVLVIEICDSDVCSGEETPPVPAAGGPRRDWPYQLVAPLSAVVAMRSAAQRVTNRTTLRLLKDRWNDDNTCIASIQVPFGGSDAPLSWHLTEAEKRAIDARWKTIETQTVGAVAAFLGTSATASPLCGGGSPR